MISQSHLEAPTQTIEAQNIRFAYRRLGKSTGTPLLLIPHFRGGMDHWDPLVTDGLGTDRPVVLFDNAGVAGSTGETPDTIEAMSDDASAFIAALDLGQIDVLGFSIGGCVAQALVMRHPEQVRRLVLVGTTHRGGEMADRDPDVTSVAGHPELTLEDYLFLFFERSETSRAAGRDFWLRRHLRTVDVDPPSSAQTAQAQRAALAEWNTPRGQRFASGQFLWTTSSGARRDQHTLRRSRTPSEATPRATGVLVLGRAAAPIDTSPTTASASPPPSSPRSSSTSCGTHFGRRRPGAH
jgi:pimeloyl-ACP methyl ester carboxylesterase